MYNNVMAKSTMKILWYEHRKIFKLFLAIFKHYAFLFSKNNFRCIDSMTFALLL